MSPHRNRLHPKMIEALMCAQSWLWSEVKKHDGKFISLIIYLEFHNICKILILVCFLYIFSRWR